MNYRDTCTITRRSVGMDPDTGGAVTTTVTVETDAACNLVPLRAAEAEQAVGASQLTDETETAHLVTPEWVTALPEASHKLDAYTVTVDGRQWRVTASKTWPTVTSYVLAA